MKGFRPGYRDDTFKILLSMSFLINGPKLIKYLVSIEPNRELSYKWKSKENIFISPDFDFRRTIENQDVAEKAANILFSVLEAVRGIQSSSQRPPYDWIIGEMQNIIALIEAQSE
jgi:hypothetical protein